MTRQAPRRRLAIAGVLAIASLAAACSRSSGDGTTGSGSSIPLAPPPALPTPSLASAPAVAPGPDSVLTAEDVEEAAEHRITEQNLESELDRLEREIQAE